MTQNPIVVRSRSGVVLTILTWALAAAGIVSALAVGWPLVAPCAFLTAGWFVWLLFWRPCVVIDDDDVQLRNIFRDATIPYGSIDSVDTRYALTVTSAGRTYRAWALAAPSGGQTKGLRSGRPGERPGDSPETPTGSAAQFIRRRMTTAAPGGTPVTRVQPALAAISVLLVGSCVLLNQLPH